MIAVHIIPVLIKISAKFESPYDLLVVYCYVDHFFSTSFKIQVLAFEAVHVDHIACSYLHSSKLFKDIHECTLLPTICN